ncbi:hypothetical protein CB1_056579052 [Camelus ferus]|nr:hypothetical protein CB1_056579052 [Camelus ferus]
MYTYRFMLLFFPFVPPLAVKDLVPTGHVWLEGDNLQNSTDSRYYGPVPYGLIRGRIFFKTTVSFIDRFLNSTKLWSGKNAERQYKYVPYAP